ncbi:MAG: phosphatase PAP2 family protein [Victivallaceae bacterium]|nr:phosphatase PAP2 family protein [Victivallaceae bacterium]
MWDLQCLLWWQEIRLAAGEALSDFLSVFTDLGPRYSGHLVFFIFWSINKECGVSALFSFAIAPVFNGLAKSIACAYRPWIRDPNIVPPPMAKAHATGYSFPSGHTCRATSTFGMIAWYYRKHVCLATVLVIFIIVIGITRNFLCVHTPQDVFCGFAIGVIGIVCTNLICKWERQKSGRDWIVLLVSLAFMTGFYLYVSLKSYPMDYVDGKLLVDPSEMTVDAWKDGGEYVGFLLGWCLEKRFVKFEIPTSWFWKIARFIPGALIFQFGTGSWYKAFIRLMEPHIGSFIFRVLLFFFLVFLYPLIFTAVERRFVKKSSGQ